MRILAWIAGGMIVAAVVFVLYGVWVGQQVGKAIVSGLIEGPRPVTVRVLEGVDLATGGLDADGLALVLHEAVTGDSPRIVTDPDQIRALAPDLWYLDQRSFGKTLTGSITAYLGVRKERDLVTVLRDGTAIAHFSCLTVYCGRDVPETGPDAFVWGMGGLAGRGDGLGRKVRQRTQGFRDYTAYLAAHQAVAADTSRWFTRPGAEHPMALDDVGWTFSLRLPTELVLAPDAKDNDSPDETLRAARAMQIAELLAGHGAILDGTIFGKLDAIGLKDARGWALRDAERRTRSLPGVFVWNPYMDVTAPPSARSAILAQVAAAPAPAGIDSDLVAARTRATLAGLGLSPACQPACPTADLGRIRTKPEIKEAIFPMWKVRSYEFAD